MINPKDKKGLKKKIHHTTKSRLPSKERRLTRQASHRFLLAFPVSDMVGKRKNRSKVLRNIARAKERGETYVVPDWWEGDAMEDGGKGKGEDKKKKKKKKLEDFIKSEEEVSKMNAKERRKYKRTLESIEAECTEVDVKEFRESKRKREKEEETQKEAEEASGKIAEGDDGAKKATPYVVFVGQISYNTTKEQLKAHLLEQATLTTASPTVRMRTTKEGKFRGTAFVEVETAEDLHALLSAHRTVLNGRRINVERTGGGGTETRKKKVKALKVSQEEEMKSKVERIVQERMESGEIMEGELDDGVLSLLNRHRPGVVEQALKEYVEMKGDGLKNPSSYLTSIVTRVSLDGVEKSEAERKKMRQKEREGKGGRRGGAAKAVNGDAR